MRRASTPMAIGLPRQSRPLLARWSVPSSPSLPSSSWGRASWYPSNWRITGPLRPFCSSLETTATAAAAASNSTPDPTNGAKRQQVQSLFSLFDSDGDGRLTHEDIRKAVLEATAPTAQFRDDQIEEMMRVADTDNSGYVEMDEFLKLFEDIDGPVTMSGLVEYWSKTVDIKDPTMTFTRVWNKLSRQLGGEQNLCFPSELLFLGGAPGSGKGTNTAFILKQRGITAPPIVVSSLLQSPHAQKIKAQGGLVGDAEVLELLLFELAKEVYREGALIDGFPRTETQVLAIKLLRDKMKSLHQKYQHLAANASSAGGGDALAQMAARFPRPRFRMAVLYVDEKESIRRQIHRGKMALEHNARIRESGDAELLSQLIEVRETDISVKAAKVRFETFNEQTLKCLSSLKELFPYNVIDASGSIEEVQRIIAKELKYQSSLELNQDTYNTLKDIPLAAELTQHARLHLVQRLDDYQTYHQHTFQQVARLVRNHFIPLLKRQALIGVAVIRCNDPILDDPKTLNMVIDILADRDFRATVDPLPPYRFHITFDKGAKD
ncbi:adenylate kinase [Balamuthia mandrillaris]